MTDLRSGGLSARELAEMALERASTGSDGAYRELRDAVAEAEAADAAFALGRDPGPLCGLPLSVKDLFGLSGSRVHAGAKAALPERFEAPGPLIRRAANQLAVFVGKTHTVEFAFGGIGTNAHWGTPRNLRAPDVARAPGGSSSGAGLSLAEGSAVLAFGTDTAGSVRIPAAWTGACGLKTTKGRWSTEGIVPLSTTLDTPGILARSVADLAVGFAALDGPAESFGARLEGTRSGGSARLGLARGVFRERCSPGVWEAIEGGLSRLEAAGLCRIEDADLGGLAEAEALFGVGGPTAIELHGFLSRELPDWLEALDPAVKDRLTTAASTPASEYVRRRAGLEVAHRAAMASFEGIDVFVSPTVAITPPTLSELDDLDVYRDRNLLTLRNPGLVSFLGLCALSLPCGVDAEGLPVGLQLIGPAGAEARLLGLARRFEPVLRGG